MKLLLCRKCYDVFKLNDERVRFCQCGAIGGRLIDGLNAEYWGQEAVPLGFANSTLAKAVVNRPADGMGRLFDAFVIPIHCETMKKVRKPRGKK